MFEALLPAARHTDPRCDQARQSRAVDDHHPGGPEVELGVGEDPLVIAVGGPVALSGGLARGSSGSGAYQFATHHGRPPAVILTAVICRSWRQNRLAHKPPTDAASQYPGPNP